MRFTGVLRIWASGSWEDAGGRGEVEGPAGMAGQPCAHLGVFVGGIVVDDGVDRLSLRTCASLVLRKRMNS
jgi:hypothetical protein